MLESVRTFPAKKVVKLWLLRGFSVRTNNCKTPLAGIYCAFQEISYNYKIAAYYLVQ